MAKVTLFFLIFAQNMTKNVTIKDIAREAGVSIALVSFVMNNRIGADGKQKYRVSQATQERIREVAARMNYQPSSAARMLRQGRTRVIGVILSDLGNIFYGIIAKEMEKILTRKGYTVLFGSTEEDPERFGRLVQSFLEKDVEGFIIVPCVGCGQYVERLQASGRPFVAIDRHHPSYDIPSVLLDNVGAMQLAVGALKKQGVRKMGLFTYEMRTSAMIEREKGFREEMGHNAPIYRMGFYTMKEDTRKAADAILEAGLDGIVCASNEISALLIKELIHRGIRVQEDIHIAGFDYSNVYDIFTPHIPHVEQPLPQMAKESTDYLFRLIDKKDRGEDISKEKDKIVLKANLI